MLQRRFDTRYHWRLIAAFVAGMAIFAGIIALGTKLTGAVYQVVVGGGLGTIVAVVLAMRWLRGHLRCGGCGRWIEGPANGNAPPGTPIQFYCPGCDILWSTRATMGHETGDGPD